jgi:replicative DNA helicase
MIEKIILTNLVHSSEFMRKTLPYLKSEYYSSSADRLVFEIIQRFVDAYNKPPTTEALLIEVERTKDIDDQLYTSAVEIVNSLVPSEDPINEHWLMDKTEEFCQEAALINALRKSAKILEGSKDDKTLLTKGSIPQLLSEALGVSFDSSIGHDLLGDWQERYEFYHLLESRIPFDISILNKVTNGGISKKTLTVLLAGTGVGKTLAMCHFAAANVQAGLNVLYITNEMSEERIAERIDANLLDLTIDELKVVPRATYQSKMEKLQSKVKGKLIIKEYPTSTAGAANFRHLLNELKLKKNFVPDVIYIDYINICVSSKLKRANVNSYEYIKSIAEELRGLAVEFNVPVITATQLNREGFTNSDPGLEHTSESFGLPATADLMFALTTSEELAKCGQLQFKQLKNRYRDENLDRRFVVGVDRDKMRFFDLDPRAQATVANEMPQLAKSGRSFDTKMFDDAVH